MSTETYTYASGKSEKDLASYQSVRGPEVKSIYQKIRDEGSMEISQLYGYFGRPDEGGTSKTSVDETVKFLHATDFVEEPAESIYEVISGQPFSDLPFELQLFHHVRKQKGEQKHFSDIHRIVAESDSQFIDRDRLVEELKRELGEYALDWNKQKVKMWYDLVKHFGLVSIDSNERVLTSPNPGIVYDLLEAFSDREGSPRFRQALDWIEENFCYCYAERGGARPRVHRGLSDTLVMMHEAGTIKLSAVSDATTEVEVPGLTADTTSTFELGPRPETPAYAYPLEAHSIEVSR